MDSSLPDGIRMPAGLRFVGLTGAPGVGKSTLAAALADATGAAVVPMDGFHYADVELARRGLLDRKGAPETFDAPGFAALLRRIRSGEEDVVAPMFARDLEQPLAGAIAVPASGPVIAEGNYLLLDERRWHDVRAQLDAVWHLHLPDEVRRARLIARHVAFGKSPDAARTWVDRVDEPNAALVEAAASRADRTVDLTGWSP